MDQKKEDSVSTREIIKEYDFNFLKRFGQNFLVDENVLRKIVDAAGITDDDVVLEIGPGMGILTAQLAARADKVIAVEIDERLISILQETLKDFSNIVFICQDIMKTDIPALISEYGEGHAFKVAANIPYNLTTPLVMKLTDRRLPIDSVTVMLQKEVADRMRSEPGTKDYGVLALTAAYYGVPEIVCEAGPESFIPQPKVRSVVVHIERKVKPPVDVKDPGFMFHLIRAAFQKRRKTLINAISSTTEVSVSKDEAAAAVKALGLDAAVRGEKLTLSQFAALTDKLCG